MRAYAPVIDGGGQDFRFEGFVRTFEETPPDVAQIIVEYRDAGNQLVLDSFDSGEISSVLEWQQVDDLRTSPAGTGWIRVRLLASRFTGGDNDAYFDALSLRSLATAALSVDDVEIHEGVVAAGNGGGGSDSDSDSDSDSGGGSDSDSGGGSDSDSGDSDSDSDSDSGGSGGTGGVPPDPVTTDAVFTVRLACPVDRPVTVDFTTADGTAVVDEDYLATSGQLLFEPGTTTHQVPVPVVGDLIDEPHEVFHLDLTGVASERTVISADPRGDGRILNDDFCPRSPGYWKNHAELWPVDDLEIGGVRYDAMALLDLLNSGGSGASRKLARQLVATRLDLEVGSDPAILPTVEQADLFLIDFPPGSRPTGADRQTANALKNILDAYNNADCPNGDGDGSDSDNGSDSDSGSD